jgi:hypothetical protein
MSGHGIGYMKVASDRDKQLSFYLPEQQKAKACHFWETSETEQHKMLPQ